MTDEVRYLGVKYQVLNDNGTHNYLSTYCLHGLHDDCRKVCKFCPALCVCWCHQPEAVAAA